MRMIKDYNNLRWKVAGSVMEYDFTCGYCGRHTSSVKGLELTEKHLREGYNSTYDDRQLKNSGIYICTHCQMPSFMWEEIQVPGYKFGNEVSGISEELSDLYDEARNSFSVGAFTGVVLLCRKLLMNIAVELGAKEGMKFIEYVNYLDENHYISANSRAWVDKVRTYGNEATHETAIKTKVDASNMIKFCEMIMKTNFEYPSILEEPLE